MQSSEEEAAESDAEHDSAKEDIIDADFREVGDDDKKKKKSA
jgi:hypothetical protein